MCRRRAYAGLALSLVAYTLAFIALISLCRASTNNGALVAPRLPDHLSQAQLELERLGEHVESAFHVAVAAESRKNELVAYLAHDIKTPLTSVIGYLALFAEEPDLPYEKRERFASAALDRARRLDGMMDEFFEITRYNLGSIPVEREQVDAVMLAEQVADELLPAASGRGVSIAVHAPDRPADSFIDLYKMALVLGNILKNAVAFANPSTEVLLNVRVEGESVVFAVEDTGREISPEHLVHIFEKFYRVDGARSTGHGGAGLGLAISKEIVAAHGGRHHGDERVRQYGVYNPDSLL